jgi:hypothetical protein
VDVISDKFNADKISAYVIGSSQKEHNSSSNKTTTVIHYSVLHLQLQTKQFC